MDPTVPGKYIHHKGSQYLELKPDGNYVLFEGSSRVTGTYRVNGTELTIFAAGSSSQARLEDGVITDAEGDKWTRKDELSWLPPALRHELPWELFEAIALVVILVGLFIAVMNSRS